MEWPSLAGAIGGPAVGIAGLIFARNYRPTTLACLAVAGLREQPGSGSGRCSPIVWVAWRHIGTRASRRPRCVGDEPAEAVPSRSLGVLKSLREHGTTTPTALLE